MKFTVSFGKRLAFFLCVWIFCFIAVGLIVGFLTYKFGTESTRLMRMATVLQDLILFIVPSLVTAVVITRLPAAFLGLTRGVNYRILLLAVITLGISIPVMNAVIGWNESLRLPASLSGLEAQLRASEDAAQAAVQVVLRGDTVMSLIVSILIVGVLTGFSEELFFRGTLLRLLTTRPGFNRHAAVWLVAFIFSAIHMQFYGFVPRLLLGAFFGYLMVWSGSVWIPAILHALNNSVFIFGNWLEQHRGEGAGAASATDHAADSFFGFSPAFSIALSLVLTAYFVFRLWQARQRPAAPTAPEEGKAGG